MLNTRIRNALAVGSIALIAVTGAACGGDSKTSSNGGNGTALSADEFRTKADEICRTFNATRDSVPEPSGPTEVVPYLERMLPEAQKQYDQLKALVPPAEMKPDWDAAMTALNEQITGIQKAKDRIAAGEDALTVVTEAGTTINAAKARADEKTKALGLTECGKDAGSTTSTGVTAPVVPTAPTTPSTPSMPTTPTAPTVPTTGDTPTDSPSGTVDATVFSKDTVELGTALQDFGQALQAAASGGVPAVKAKSAEMRAHLDRIDAAADRMRGYTVDNPDLERKRAAIVAATPDVTRLGRDLLDAAEANDSSRMTSVATEFMSALQRLSSAATG